MSIEPNSVILQSTDSPSVVGLDVGGTKIAGGVVAVGSGKVLLRRVIPTRARRGGDAVLADAMSLAQDLSADASRLGIEVSAVGIGVAELVDADGNIRSSQTIDWVGLPIRERFASIAPTTVDSDVRAAALAEGLYGAGAEYSLFAYVTVGTGISYSLVREGRPYTGARGNALVLGSSPLSTTCTECGTHLRPILEEIASGPALVARYNQIGGVVTRGEDVVAAAARGEEAATEVVRSAGEALGNSVGFLVNVLDPEAVIVGGGLGLAGGFFWDSFVLSTREHIWSDGTRDLPILPAALGTDAGLIGAAACTRLSVQSGKVNGSAMRLLERGTR